MVLKVKNYMYSFLIKHFNAMLFLTRVLVLCIGFYLYSKGFCLEVTLCNETDNVELCRQLSKRVLSAKTTYDSPVVYEIEKKADGSATVAFKAGGRGLDTWYGFSFNRRLCKCE